MKKVNLILLGSTDLTYSIAKKLKNIVNIVGLCSAKPKFKISYAKNFMLNSRYVEMEKFAKEIGISHHTYSCLLYTSPSPRDRLLSRMPSSA